MLNRLGIPLTEITTDAFFSTPKELKEIALHIGMILNSTERVKRGIGTIRQDVNISIAGGNRVELKGVQDVRKMDKVVDLEIQRQQSLIKIRKKLKNSKIFFGDIFDAKKYFSASDSKIFAGKESYGIFIKKFSNQFSQNLNELKTLGNEVAKIACVGTNALGIIHTDENLDKYKLRNEFEAIRKHFGLDENDLVACVVTDKANAAKVFAQLKARILMLQKEIPKETRAVLQNCDSVYMRPIAGAKRMYPETDVPKMPISKQYLKERKKNLFKTHDQKKEFYIQKLKLTEELANQIINLKMNMIFDEVQKNSSLKNIATETAKSILSYAGIIEKMKNDLGIKTTAQCFMECFDALQNNIITKQGSGIFLMEKLKNPDAETEKIITEYNIEKIDKTKLIQLITEVQKKSKTQNIKEIIRSIESSYKNQIDKKELIDLLVKSKKCL